MCLLRHGRQPPTPSAKGLKVGSRPTGMGARFVSITQSMGNVWNHVPAVVTLLSDLPRAQTIERVKAYGKARAVLANDKFWARRSARPQWKLVFSRMMAWMRQVRTVSLQTGAFETWEKRGYWGNVLVRKALGHMPLVDHGAVPALMPREIRPRENDECVGGLRIPNRWVGPYAFRSGAGSFPQTFLEPGVATTATRNRLGPCHRAPWVRAFLLPVCGFCSSQAGSCSASQRWPHTQSVATTPTSSKHCSARQMTLRLRFQVGFARACLHRKLWDRRIHEKIIPVPSSQKLALFLRKCGPCPSRLGPECWKVRVTGWGPGEVRRRRVGHAHCVPGKCQS